MTPEEILNTKPLTYNDAIEAMKEYARQERDKALDWAADNATATEDWYRGRLNGVYVDKDSIISGKTHKDLQL